MSILRDNNISVAKHSVLLHQGSSLNENSQTLIWFTNHNSPGFSERFPLYSTEHRITAL